MATLNGTVILFDGIGGFDNSFYLLRDTWAWDGSTWTQLDVVGPDPRIHAAMVGP
jgi:hypothetical protein